MPAAMRQILQQPLGVLAAEILRTISYLQQQRSLIPQQLWLFGGGALLRDMPEHISSVTGITARPWVLSPGDPGAETDAMFGTAAALSALAWGPGR